MAETRIFLVFKTHLDIGFTNLARCVREQYHRPFIPQALDTAEHFHAENPTEPKFVWTTGAWLIADYLARAQPDEVRRLERAIEHNLIHWHALPFTTHTELMSPALFRAGLSYGQELDRRFGRTTTAAKMTDVPGHTRAMVPLLAEAGVRFLHIGVNEASPVPDVPPVFRWRADTGEEVVVMYQDSYGATQFAAGLRDGLSFAHTNDNVGPHSISQTIEVYRHLQKTHTAATVIASSLDRYGDLLWQAREQFPVVDAEIGDSWIHGAGTDPNKVSRFLALQRTYDRFAQEGLTTRRLAFGRALAMVPEHTWGIDIKTFLRDEAAWDRADFAEARRTDPRFAFSERSWAEQRQYLDDALTELDDEDRTTAAAAASQAPTPPFGGKALLADTVEIGGWTVAVDQTSGDVRDLVAPDGRHLSEQNGTLFGYRYESYDASDVAEHLDSYLTRRPDWAILDHTKPGLDTARTARSEAWLPHLVRLAAVDDTIAIRLRMAEVAHRELGAPADIELIMRPLDETSIDLTLTAREKPANRMPEASFLTCTPQGAQSWFFRKLGIWQQADRVVPRGGGQLQAVQAVRADLAGNVLFEIRPLDSPLVSPSAWRFMKYHPGQPDFSAGIRFNLHNNKWGTNFPMWWEGDLVARFTLTLLPAT